jgi:alginate O-acetyltransferase complex protein AlgI
LLFTSASFLLLFLPATLVVYWAARGRGRIVVLLVASYVFYLSWRPLFGLLLAASTVVNFELARRLPEASRPKRVLAVGVTFNLAVLATFKYLGLLSESAGDLAALLGVGSSGYDGIRIALPLAISFFTFEMISVLVDVYRGQVRVGGFLTFATYKAFFPKLISGPITRYRELVPQLERQPTLSFERFQSGLGLLALGLAKKLALANNLAVLADAGFNSPTTVNAGVAAVAILAFGFQILLDFSAYTDMARGVSRMLGVDLPRNFDLPYAATSIREFWRRWHMSLSRWLRDYLYIPLGGNRGSQRRTYFNLMATMTLGGLWHGAAWHFLIWGAIHGVLLCVSHVMRGRRALGGAMTSVAGWVATMAAVFVAWVFFRANSVADALHMLGALSRPLQLDEPTALYDTLRVKYALAGLLLALVAYPLGPRIKDAWSRRSLASPRLRFAVVAAATVTCWTVAGLMAPSHNAPFIYFQF